MRIYAHRRPSEPVTMEHTRPSFIVDDLNLLAGPSAGVVILPLHLDWSADDRSYDLSQPESLRTLYEVVLREARSEADIENHLNATLLRATWPTLRLPAFLKAAWLEVHPELECQSHSAHV